MLAACLHLAASEGIAPIVEFLLEKGADVNVEDRWGGTPLRDALREGHKKVAKLLHSRGGNLGQHSDTPISQMERDLQALLAA